MFNRVVFPAPKNPERTVTGSFALLLLENMELRVYYETISVESFELFG